MFYSFEQVVLYKLILINLYQSLERVLFYIVYNTKIRNILLAHSAILAGFGF